MRLKYSEGEETHAEFQSELNKLSRSVSTANGIAVINQPD